MPPRSRGGHDLFLFDPVFAVYAYILFIGIDAYGILSGMKKRLMIPVEHVERRILLIRGHNVMLDSDLAELYGVETKALNRAVRRNRERFPEGFMFQLTREEHRSLRYQFGTLEPKARSEAQGLRSQFVTLESGRGKYSKYLPMAFTEQGVAMLSSVLRSHRAIQVNIAIMKTFVRLRELMATHRDLAEKIATLESKYDAQFRVVFDAIRKLLAPPARPRRRIGFHA